MSFLPYFNLSLFLTLSLLYCRASIFFYFLFLFFGLGVEVFQWTWVGEDGVMNTFKEFGEGGTGETAGWAQRQGDPQP